MTDGLFTLTLIASVGCGLVGGVFFAFSTFVMAALKRLPAAEGMAAMQTINVTAVTPPFMTALFGTAVVATAAAVWAAIDADGGSAALAVAAAVLYLVGNVVTTMARNVPLNDRLAALEPQTSGAATAFWNEYVVRWTAWNHVRTVTALAAAAAFAGALDL